MTARQIRVVAQQWFESNQDAIVVEVAQARGSAPRGAGTRMLVSAERALGTIGGGHLEAKALARARALLTEHRETRAAPSERFALGPALGQCCGGAVTLAYRSLDADALAAWPVCAAHFHLLLFGAGHVGRALVRQLSLFDVDIDWIDERESEFGSGFEFDCEAAIGNDVDTAARIRRVCVDGVDAEVDHAPPGAFYLVMTHSHDLDFRICEAVLRRGDFGWLGLIGSRTKRERFVRRLTDRGLPADTIARMLCPIGNGPLGDGIEASDASNARWGANALDPKAPEMIAITVASQLLRAAAFTG